MKWPWKKNKNQQPAPAEVPDAWDFYPCQVDHASASIFLNMYYARVAPLVSHGHVMWATLQISDPGEHGMGTQAAADVLNPLEDAITGAAVNAGLHYVGRLRNNGEWQLFFYGKEGQLDLLNNIVTRAMNGQGLEYRSGSKPDPDWSCYSEFLYPDTERHRWMMDFKVVEQLRSHNDPLIVPRVIDHCVVFPGKAGVDEFCSKVQAQGFETELNVRDDEYSPFVLEVRREDPVTLQEIHAVVMEVAGLAEEYGGDYDGWGCSVVSADEVPA